MINGEVFELNILMYYFNDQLDESIYDVVFLFLKFM